jgi:hypothetical protein
MGLSKFAPPPEKSVKRPLQTSAASSSCLRPGLAKAQARSVLAVSLGFDGLLRSTTCRSIAPCCRPWGSPRFWTQQSRLLSTPRQAEVQLSAATTEHHPRWRSTLQSFSLVRSSSASPRPMPSRRSIKPRLRAHSTNRKRLLWHARKLDETADLKALLHEPSPLCTSRRCRQVATRCFLGLLIP